MMQFIFFKTQIPAQLVHSISQLTMPFVSFTVCILCRLCLPLFNHPCRSCLLPAAVCYGL